MVATWGGRPPRLLCAFILLAIGSLFYCFPHVSVFSCGRACGVKLNAPLFTGQPALATDVAVVHPKWCKHVCIGVLRDRWSVFLLVCA